jgi:hypothetical protein
MSKRINYMRNTEYSERLSQDTFVHHALVDVISLCCRQNLQLSKTIPCTNYVATRVSSERNLITEIYRKYA